MKAPPWILPLFLGGALSAIYFLPKVGAVAQSAVEMKLPQEMDGWVFEGQPASEAEIKTLAPDTQFSKGLCYRERPGEINSYGNPAQDNIQLSIVLSGADINNSIHRPERCMPAQGHNITGTSSSVLKLSNGRELETKRLVSVLGKKDLRVQDRETYLKYNCLTYYFFVGHDRLSNDHLKRTLLDMQDRLLRGMDQRWAYVTVTMSYGKIPGEDGEGISQEEADAKLVKFLTEFSEGQINWKQITH
ncbi:EpsI family protein [Luteolibacter yonseiensis]|uniref:EpsI family protein n=1 Tax=Luteolibacter yonseiensis TaxID=1144680 RepID=A0A934R342_9BACT|nr:EpsI family protein [Luteolibacter yonseiensis]MBK1814420.1 EpsI family protein [Luteolibacter yonseiensis]